MGTSTDAILVFGVPIEDGDGDQGLPSTSIPGDVDLYTWMAEIEGKALADAGLVEPTDKDIKAPEWSKWRDKRFEIITSIPVDLVHHCSGDYPMYILALRGTDFIARRGYPRFVSPANLEVPMEKVYAFKKFCEDHNIPYVEPRWILCSYWG